MDLTTIILGIVGIVLSLIFSYFPPAKVWFEAQKNKGLLMLAFVVIVAAIYFGLGCTSLAAQLQIKVSCDQAGLFEMGKVLFALASGNQLAYLFSQPGTAK